MKYRYKALIFVFLFLAGFARAEEVVHIMQKGETIYSIARFYGVNHQEVLNHNKISDARTIQAGQRIRIPSAGNSAQSLPQTSSLPEAPSPVGTRSAYSEYRVEKNDTLYSLARRYNIKLEELLDMNGFAPGYVLKAGEKIRVPAVTATAPVVAGQGKPTATQEKPPAAGASTGGSSPAASGPSSGEKAPVTPSAGTIKPDPAVSWPVKAKDVSYLTGGLYGVQVTGERREPVKSLTRGTVVSTGPFRGFGNVAIVQKSDGYLYVYGGCETLSVKEGDKVTPGTELGKLGIDAKTAKPQLFFLVYRGNTPVDPVKAPRT